MVYSRPFLFSKSGHLLPATLVLRPEEVLGFSVEDSAEVSSTLGLPAVGTHLRQVSSDTLNLRLTLAVLGDTAIKTTRLM